MAADDRSAATGVGFCAKNSLFFSRSFIQRLLEDGTEVTEASRFRYRRICLWFPAVLFFAGIIVLTQHAPVQDSSRVRRANDRGSLKP